MLGSDIIKPHLKKSYKDFLKTIYTFPSQSWTKRKNQVKFLFSHFFVVSQKVLKSFIKINLFQKEVTKKNKAPQIFRRNVRFFGKFERALFSCYIRFEICSIPLLPTIWDSVWYLWWSFCRKIS